MKLKCKIVFNNLYLHANQHLLIYLNFKKVNLVKSND